MAKKNAAAKAADPDVFDLDALSDLVTDAMNALNREMQTRPRGSSEERNSAGLYLDVLMRPLAKAFLDAHPKYAQTFLDELAGKADYKKAASETFAALSDVAFELDNLETAVGDVNLKHPASHLIVASTFRRLSALRNIAGGPLRDHAELLGHHPESFPWDWS